MADLEASINPLKAGDIAEQILAKIAEHFTTGDAINVLVNAITLSLVTVLKGLDKIAVPIAAGAGQLLTDLEEPVMPIVAAFAAPIIAGLFGTEASEESFKNRGARGDRAAAAGSIVEAFTAALAGDASGPIAPGDEGARRIAAAAVHAAIEGWLNERLPDVVSKFIPIDWLHFDDFAGLSEEIIRTLGVGRLVRRAFTPLINATAATPMQWYANQKYRPTKLPVSTVVREYVRGRLELTDLQDQLARDGYRDEEMQALVNEQQKTRSAVELELLARVGAMPAGAAVQELRDAGWNADVAQSLLDVERFKRLAAFEIAMADAAITAFAEGRVDEGALDTYTHGVSIDEQHSAQLRELAHARKALRNRPLTPPEAKACVEAGILAVIDYRTALDDAGYSERAADALELLLRKQLLDKHTVEEHRQQLAADKAAAAAARAKAAADAKIRIEQARALKQRGSIAELETAVERGLIPIGRLEEVLAAEFDPDTVGVYVAVVEAKREAYLATQQRAANAAKRAAAGGLSIGELQAALNEGVLTIDQVTPQLTARGLSAEDVDVLARTMAETAAAKQAAAALRAKAAQRTATHPLALGTAEALVKAGHWTLAQFNGYLRGLSYTDADIVSLDALVQDAIAKAHAARAIQTATTAANAAKGLTLAQFKNAVVLGLKSLAEYGFFLTAEGFSADATATLVAEAQDALTTADAARARRAAAGGAADGSAVPLADWARAARLGLIPPAQYAAALQARGYSEADAALELDLLATEIAAAHTPAPAAGTADATIASGTGTPQQTAALKHVQVDGELAAKGLSLATTEKAVKDGLLSLDGYQAWVEANGYGPADAELLRALLALQLPAPGG